MCEECLDMHEDDVKPAKDAKRQKFLLDQMAAGDNSSRWR